MNKDMPDICGCPYFWKYRDEILVACIHGNNFDIVTYADTWMCSLCGAEHILATFTEREAAQEGYVDVDATDGQSPARWGT